MSYHNLCKDLSVSLVAPFAIGFSFFGCSPPLDSDKHQSDPIASTSGDERNPLGHSGVQPSATKSIIRSQFNSGPVAIECSSSESAIKPGDLAILKIAVKIAPGYEIYSLDESPPKTPTQLTLNLPDGWRVDGDWKSPSPRRSMNPAGGAVYAGDVLFQRSVRVADQCRPGEYEIQCSVHYQACNDIQCLRPTRADLPVVIMVLDE